MPPRSAGGLETIGLEPDERGNIPVDGALRTAVDGVWALGDVNGRGAFTHTAVQDYEVAWNRLQGGARSVDGRTPTYAVFIDPPLGHVGMTEREARASGRSVLKGGVAMADVSRARLEEETEGMIKVLVDADSERFLGCTVFGMQGDDIVQIVGALMQADAPYTALKNALPVHPTVAEFFPTILGGLEPLDE